MPVAGGSALDFCVTTCLLALTSDQTIVQPTTVSLGQAGKKGPLAPGSFSCASLHPTRLARLRSKGPEAKPTADPHGAGLAQLCTSPWDYLAIGGVTTLPVRTLIN